MFKAVFFDLDGVLVNSEIQEQIWTKEYLDKNGIKIPIQRFELFIGSHKKQNMWEKFIKGYENEIDDIETFKKGLRLYKINKRSSFNYEQILFPDIKKYLNCLKDKSIKIACASSSSIDYIQNVLSKCHIISYFDLITTGDDFIESKPSPEIYQYCMHYFNLNPHECLVIEDSVFGIEAGKRARMYVIARKTPFKFSQAQANMIVDDLNETTSLFK